MVKSITSRNQLKLFIFNGLFVLDLLFNACTGSDAVEFTRHGVRDCVST